MPKHKPIKFEALDQGFVKQINKIISENKTAKSILNATLAIMATGGIITLGALAPGLLMEINKISGNENHYLGLRKKSGVRIETLRQEVSNIYIIHAKHILSILPFPHSVF